MMGRGIAPDWTAFIAMQRASPTIVLDLAVPDSVIDLAMQQPVHMLLNTGMR